MIPRRADDRDLRRWKPRTRPEGLAVHRQPQGEVCRALAFRWIGDPVIAVAVDVQDVHLIEASSTSSAPGWFQRRCCNRLRSATARGLVGPESAPADHSGSPRRCAVLANYGSAELHDAVDSWAGGCRRHLSLRNPPPAVVRRNRRLDKAAHRAHCPVSTIRCDMAHRARGRSRRRRAVMFQCGSCKPVWISRRDRGLRRTSSSS